MIHLALLRIGPRFFFEKWWIMAFFVSGGFLFLISWLIGDEKGRPQGCFGSVMAVLKMLWVLVLIFWGISFLFER